MSLPPANAMSFKLNIVDYFFKKFSYELLSPYTADSNVVTIVPESIRVGVSISKIETSGTDMAGQYVARVGMQLSVDPESDSDLKFKVFIEALGMITSDHDFWEDQGALQIVVSAAVSVMFGAARDRIGQFSADGPSPKLLMPLVAPGVVAKDAIEHFLSNQAKSRSLSDDAD